MEPDRRQVIAILATTFGVSGLPALALSTEEAALELMARLDVTEGGITLKMPDVAEDGYRVPVELGAEGAAEISLIAPENPNPLVAAFRFGKLSPSRRVSTKIRLARTQTVVALAKMQDGSFRKTSKPVTVLIGGCGA